MTIIELLNKIANGEEVPKKIKYRSWVYEYNTKYHDFMCDYETLLLRDEIANTKDFLNGTVEIIEEEKKIEKLDVVLLGQCDNWTRKYNRKISEFDNTRIEINPYIIDNIRENTINFQNKINELIDEINKLKEGK